MSSDRSPLARTLSLAVHEFRTPLTVVAGYLRMLLREQGGPLTDKQRRMLEEAERSCTRLGTLVSDMSDLARLEAHETALSRQEIDVGALMAELAGSLHEGADRGVRLEIHRQDAPLAVLGDRGRLAAALATLVTSALRERGEPGTVAVDCSAAGDDQPWVVVAIGDPSVLAPLRDARHEPAPFDEWRGGQGLALSIARRVIEAHGGVVWSLRGSPWRAAAGLKLPQGGQF